VADGIEDDIEEVEVQVFDDDQPAPTQRIYSLKREVIEFHRAVWPLLTPLDALERGGYTRVPEELRRYFRDVHDHARRVDEQVNSQRELLTSVLEANLALVSVTQNEVVKKISSVAAIIALPTFIASVYGMNFEYMPELDERIGYPLALAAMVVTAAALAVFFRRINWL
jgi:magnesium transporter